MYNGYFALRGDQYIFQVVVVYLQVIHVYQAEQKWGVNLNNVKLNYTNQGGYFG